MGFINQLITGGPHLVYFLILFPSSSQRFQLPCYSLNGQELADARKATEEAIAKEAAAADAVREAEAMAAMAMAWWNDGNPMLVGGDWNIWMIFPYTHRIHGAAIYGNMDPINIPPMLAYYIYHTWILWVYWE